MAPDESLLQRKAIRVPSYHTLSAVFVGCCGVFMGFTVLVYLFAVSHEAAQGGLLVVTVLATVLLGDRLALIRRQARWVDKTLATALLLTGTLAGLTWQSIGGEWLTLLGVMLGAPVSYVATRQLATEGLSASSLLFKIGKWARPMFSASLVSGGVATGSVLVGLADASTAYLLSGIVSIVSASAWQFYFRAEPREIERALDADVSIRRHDYWNQNEKMNEILDGAAVDSAKELDLRTMSRLVVELSAERALAESYIEVLESQIELRGRHPTEKTNAVEPEAS